MKWAPVFEKRQGRSAEEHTVGVGVILPILCAKPELPEALDSGHLGLQLQSPEPVAPATG